MIESDRYCDDVLLQVASTINALKSLSTEILKSHMKTCMAEEIKKGNKQAELTKILYDAQKGLCAIDRESNIIELAKGVHELAGKGVYPEDLSKDEFHSIIINMLKEGKAEELDMFIRSV